MRAWSVTIELGGTGPAVGPEALGAFAEALAAYSAVATGTPEEPPDGRGRYGAALSVDADEAVGAVASAAELIKRAAADVGLPDWPVVFAEAVEESELERRLSEPAFPALLGVRELAELLGVSGQRASALAKSAEFPKPVARLAGGGPVWTETSVRRFVGEWQRRPGPRRRSA